LNFLRKKRVYLGRLLRILQNVIKKILINWRVLQLVKVNTRRYFRYTCMCNSRTVPTAFENDVFGVG
jgi:hypothetical protein